MAKKRIKIGNLTFDDVSYDEAGDVLYLHVGKPQSATDAEETPEGHFLRYDAQGRVAGLTIVNARWLLERDGEITVTLPQPLLHANARDLAEVVGLAG